LIFIGLVDEHGAGFPAPCFFAFPPPDACGQIFPKLKAGVSPPRIDKVGGVYIAYCLITKGGRMILSSPITITPPAITRANGEVRVRGPITFTELDITIIDNSNRKSVMATIRPCPKPLALWQKAAYTAAGDYTQAQVEARVTELLGNDPKAVLEGLFQFPSRPAVSSSSSSI
jgi:hypothetical protein